MIVSAVVESTDILQISGLPYAGVCNLQSLLVCLSVCAIHLFVNLTFHGNNLRINHVSKKAKQINRQIFYRVSFLHWTPSKLPK